MTHYTSPCYFSFRKDAPGVGWRADWCFYELQFQKWFIWSSHVYICKYLSKDQQFQHCLIQQRLMPFLWKLPFLSFWWTIFRSLFDNRCKMSHFGRHRLWNVWRQFTYRNDPWVITSPTRYSTSKSIHTIHFY